MCPYVGGSLTSFFNQPAQTLTEEAAHKMADKGGEKIKEIAVMNTPVDTGELRGAWQRLPAVPEVRDGVPTWRSTVRNPTKYAGYVENGTGIYGPNHAPYVIRPKLPGGVLRWVGKDGQVHFAKSVLHPGSPGHHMLAIGLNVTAGLVEGGALFSGELEAWAKSVEAAAMRGTV